MRLTIGSQAPNFSVQALGGRQIDLAAFRGRPVLLKFYRFATCPVCNLHMHRFIKEYDKVQALGITAVVVYHSPAEKLQAANIDLPPFPLVPDPEKRIFKACGVERGWAGMFSPAVMRDYIRAMRAGFPPGMLTNDGGITGNPADFLIDGDGCIVYAHYGRHYADSLDASQIAGIYANVPAALTKQKAAEASTAKLKAEIALLFI
jgi:peroxiredoxin Q/BCP